MKGELINKICNFTDDNLVTSLVAFLKKDDYIRYMHKKGKKALRLFSALSLIGLGIVGCIFPILPGIPILLVGIYLINPQKFKKWALKIKSKFFSRNQH